MSEKTKIPTKYFDFSNIFSSNSIIKLLEYNGINDYSINLLDIKQLYYGLTYSLELIGLEILKIYIKVNQTSSLIRLFKSLTNTTILFI